MDFAFSMLFSFSIKYSFDNICKYVFQHGLFSVSPSHHKYLKVINHFYKFFLAIKKLSFDFEYSLLLNNFIASLLTSKKSS